MFRIGRARQALGRLAFLGLIPGLMLLSCHAASVTSRGTTAPPAAMSQAMATTVPPTSTEAASAGASANATPAASLIAIGSLGTLVASTPTASANAGSPSIAAPAMATATTIPGATPSAQPAAAVTETPGPAARNARAVPAMPLRTVQSSQGGYSIAVPDGWTLNAAQGTGLLTMTPAGRQEPLIYVIPALRVSDVRYQAILTKCNQQFTRNPLGSPEVITTCIEPAVRSQLADSSHLWSPQAAFPVILALAAGAGTTYGSPRINGLSSTEIRYSVSATKNGQTFDDWGYLAMTYLPNPLLASSSGQPGVTSLAFLTGCEAPASQADSFRQECEGVLRSFQPSQQWANNLAQQVMQSYVQEYQTLLQIGQSVVEGFGFRSAMIQQFGATIRQMQFQAFQNIQAANLRMGEDWIAALGNETYVQDPNTGISYLVPAGYATYCLNDARDEVLLGGNDLVRGKSVDSPSNYCGTLLQPRGA